MLLSSLVALWPRLIFHRPTLLLLVFIALWQNTNIDVCVIFLYLYFHLGSLFLGALVLNFVSVIIWNWKCLNPTSHLDNFLLCEHYYCLVFDLGPIDTFVLHYCIMDKNVLSNTQNRTKNVAFWQCTATYISALGCSVMYIYVGKVPFKWNYRRPM